VRENQNVAEIADLPIMAQRRAVWRRHNRLDRVRPLILVFPEGSWRELLPATALQCRADESRAIEMNLRQRIYSYQNFEDDKPVEKRWIVRKRISDSGWGLEPRYHDRPDPVGAWGFDAVIKTPDDLARLRFPVVAYDAEQTARDLAAAQDLFGDILDVHLKGIDRIHVGLMDVYCKLRGLQQVMVDMYENPAMLHDAMSFLAEGYSRRLQQYVAQNLLSLNNDETYHSSGGVGYSTELPRTGFDPQRVSPGDMWGSAQSQEMAQVSPAQHREFVMQHEHKLLTPFGLTGYGCCEDLTNKLDDVLAMPHMRRISISPWANVDRCAERIGKRAIFSWKPHPAHLAGSFDPQVIRAYIAHTLDVTSTCVIEMILKDTHTCDHQPERFTIWTQEARRLAEQC
jgi:hypothetical protein